MILLLKCGGKQPVPFNKDDKRALEMNMRVLSTVYNYMAEHSPQKGMIHAALAKKPEREDGDGKDESPDTGTNEPETRPQDF
jgi:hypothetical protein